MTIKLYWCRGKGRDDNLQKNFGDYLSPLIISRLSGEKVEYSPVKSADVISIGSILKRLHKLRGFPFPKKLIVWGSGAGVPDLRYPGHHNYIAVRGEHSLKLLDCKEKESIVLGDPGLLADQLFDLKRISRKRRIGIIPHYVDAGASSLVRLCHEYENIKVLSVYTEIEELLSEIKNCDLVLSSSLHGLIVSDSLGVPNAWLKISEKLDSDFKFYDYYSIWGESMKTAPLKVEELSEQLFDKLIAEYQRDGLDSIKSRLINSMPF